MPRPDPPRPEHIDQRLSAGLAWSRHRLGVDPSSVTPVAGDASFRRYFRLGDGERTWILMDAPPEAEDSAPFVDIAHRIRAGGLHAPEILHADLDQGFLLLEDLGDALLRDELTTNNADHWFPRLFDVLAALAVDVDASGLPEYDRDRLIEELELFPRWYLERHHGITLSCEQWDVWEALCTQLVADAYAQPRVFVHRDFHSCNLLAAGDGSIGIIDFQDGVRGPLTYDFISLLWDRYIHWPRSRLEGWMEDFRQRVAPDTASADWVRWCDAMGLQRNLKVVGIFARLKHRDGKQGYVEMIPQFWRYVRDTLPRYPDFAAFSELLDALDCEPG